MNCNDLWMRGHWFPKWLFRMDCRMSELIPWFTASLEQIPSGELTFCHGKSPFLMGKSTISMAIFNCYVSSPEGIPKLVKQGLKKWERPSLNHSSKCLPLFSTFLRVLVLGPIWNSVEQQHQLSRFQDELTQPPSRDTLGIFRMFSWWILLAIVIDIDNHYIILCILCILYHILLYPIYGWQENHDISPFSTNGVWKKHRVADS